jgi:transposase
MDGRELKQYERWKEEAHRLRGENQHLRLELWAAQPALYRAGERIYRLRQRVQKLATENAMLRQRVKDLTARVKFAPADQPAPPAGVKANLPPRECKKPGRKPGHPAALRPMPPRIDVHQHIALPIDSGRHVSCPHCNTQLAEVERHKRIVEDIIPAKIITTCYHTTSGYCPCCRKRVESRGEDQPPAADLPHAQLGINALATAAVMRVCYRLPLRQISSLLAQLPGLRVCPGAIVKQIKRLSRWLRSEYDALKLTLRAADVVHADETGWRVNGKNGYLWTLTDPQHTLYHVDRTRKGKVIRKLLGKGFAGGGGTLVSDFYSAYNRVGGSQQKCLVHLLRELRNVIAKRQELSGHAFFTRCKQLVQAMLALKDRRQELQPSTYKRNVRQLEKQLDELSRTRWNDPDADRLSARLVKYHDQLTTFLHRREVDGTNNAAERALRPVVVMRKITGGSRSRSAAKAWAILASIMRSAQQQDQNVLELTKTLLRGAWSGKPLPVLANTS